MAGRSVAVVFGGAGFVGRYIVQRLARAGHVVRIAGRDTNAAGGLRPMGAVGQVVPLFADLTEPGTVARAIDGAEIVVNCVGLLAERRPGDFQRVQGEGPGLIGAAATEAGARHVVHLSAIGADPASPSRYAQTKAQGEQTLLAAFPKAAILRPSLLFGPEDQFFNRFGALAAYAPVMPVICGATRMQPVYVGDVADAAMAALARPDAAGRTYELGGPRVWTFREILAWILEQTGRRRPLLTIPMSVARLEAQVLERLPGKLLTQDQLILLARDNVCSGEYPGLVDLGITPTPVELAVPQYLNRFRPGGRRREVYAA
jgi:NADH dehydrogenase